MNKPIDRMKLIAIINIAIADSLREMKGKEDSYRDYAIEISGGITGEILKRIRLGDLDYEGCESG